MNKNRKPRIAVVEDETDLCDSIVDYLHANGYPAWGVVSAEAFFRQLLLNPVDVLVLDIGLPGESGLSVTQHVAQRADMAIIIVSGRDSVDDRLTGLNCGADRYLVKPVDLRELTANIEAVWRIIAPQEVGDPPAQVLPDSPPWQLDGDEWRLVDPDGGVIPLTSREYLFVRRLVADEGQVVSKDAIAETLEINTEANGLHRIDVLVARLRKKALEATGKVIPIKTVHNQGFIFIEKCRQV